MSKKEKKKDKKLEYVADFRDEIKRLNRVVGQIEGVKKMLSEKRKLSDIIMQSKAIHSALRSIEERVIEHYLDIAVEAISTEKKKTRKEHVAALKEIYSRAA